MPDLQQQLADLRKDFEELKEQVRQDDIVQNYHKHLGYDGSDKLPQFVFPGYVKSDGTSAAPYFLPSGWTCTKTGTGAYTITHNLGTLSYNVVLSVGGATVGLPVIYTIALTNFTLSTFSSGAALQNQDFTFIVTLV